MMIQDAKPGDVLRDKDGDVWMVEAGFVACVVEGGRACLSEGDYRWSVRDAEKFGPFTRLVPKKETL